MAIIVKDILKAYHEDALHWCKNKPWIIYAIWPLYFGWLLSKQWYFIIRSSQYWGARTWFSAIDLGIHELGHEIFDPFGELMMYAGGSLLQCLVPFACAIGFLRQRHYFAIGVMGAWTSINMFEVATYMADAQERQLPLVAPGTGAVAPGDAAMYHDWFNILYMVGMLKYDNTIAFLTRLLATVVMIASLTLLSWLVYRMYSPPKESTIITM